MKIVLLICFVLAITSTGFAQFNGSFEEGDEPGAIMTLLPGYTTVSGWTIVSGNVDYVGNFWQASDGVRSLDLNGDTGAGKISQTLTTVPGLMYQVTFDMSGNPDGTPNLKNMSVKGGSSAAQTYSYDTSINGNNHNDMKWVSNTYYFIATGTASTLSFESLISGPFGPLLDNVNVTNITAQICHRDKGKPGQKTLTVGVSAISAHLGHGDTLGPCS